MPFGIQPIHLIIVLVVALVIFGPSRLPEIGRGVGRAINEFRRGTKEMTESFRDEMVHTDETAPRISPSTNSQPYNVPAAPPAPQPVATAPMADQAQAVQVAGNFCNQCGAPNPAGANFCNKCGTPLPGLGSGSNPQNI